MNMNGKIEAKKYNSISDIGEIKEIWPAGVILKIDEPREKMVVNSYVKYTRKAPWRSGYPQAL